MLDTNAFNRALDGSVDPVSLSSRGKLFVTHVQLNEIQATPSKERLEQLLGVFAAVDQEKVPAAAAVWDVSEWDSAEWGGADGAYAAMLASLNARNNSKKSNARDVLIAVTALKRAYTLVTDDRDLAAVLQESGGKAITFEQLVRG
ncbi:MAG TPA: PIN domain-containing protein [Burkholderiales bacterium]|nr:PIN domain-containing protein [Burkholderiales bacterium]